MDNKAFSLQIVFSGLNTGVIREMVLLSKALNNKAIINFYHCHSLNTEKVFGEEDIEFPHFSVSSTKKLATSRF